MRNHLLQSPQLMPATEMHEQRRFDYMSAVAMENETVAIDVVALKLLHGDFIWVVLAVKAWTSMIAQKFIQAFKLRISKTFYNYINRKLYTPSRFYKKSTKTALAIKYTF